MDMQHNNTPVDIDIGTWLGDIFRHMSTRWNQYLKPFGLAVVGVFALLLVFGCAGGIGVAVASQLGDLAPLVMAPLGLVLGLGAVTAVAPLGLGMCRGTQAALRGEDFTVEHLTGAFGDFLPAVGTAFLAGLVVFVGALACGIGALVAAPLVSVAMPLLADRGGSPMDAVKGSVDLVKPNFVMVLVFMLVLALVNGALNLIPLVGAVVGGLMQLVASNYLYLRLSQQASGVREDGVISR